MRLTRRQFLTRSAVGMSAYFLPRGTARVAQASTTVPVLVALYLRGGADGLNLVVPISDPLYYTNRPTIQVPAGTELTLDGFYGLNPVLGDLLPYYQSGDLCFIHASGSTDESRSHFDAQDFMEKAAPGDKSVADGWLSRYLSVAGGGDAVAGISIAGSKMLAMEGLAPSLAFKSIARFALDGAYTDERRAALEARYALDAGTLLGDQVADALGAVDLIASVDTSTSVVYPAESNLGARLADAAALIKADIGVRVIAIDFNGWDHHSDEVLNITELGSELSAALDAFMQDLGPCTATTLTLCMTEFGRRVAENGGDGSDHGHGGLMFGLGGGVSGGQVITKDGVWPGLAPGDLFKGQDLAVTTDFRDIFAEVLTAHLGLSIGEADSVFPGFTVDAASYPGLFP